MRNAIIVSMIILMVGCVSTTDPAPGPATQFQTPGSESKPIRIVEQNGIAYENGVPIGPADPKLAEKDGGDEEELPTLESLLQETLPTKEVPMVPESIGPERLSDATGARFVEGIIHGESLTISRFGEYIYTMSVMVDDEVLSFRTYGRALEFDAIFSVFDKVRIRVDEGGWWIIELNGYKFEVAQ